ncbi:MAG: polysaccharide deacetylase family protein [Clostridia bacterium]|nr:polysaccharide deacetylase family protein [Clostridia bacterium]
MKKFLTLLMALALLLPLCGGAAAEGYQDCHRVVLTKTDTTQDNGSIIRVWQADTVLDSVDEELASIQQDMVDRFGPELPAGKNKTSKSSRLDVELRYSRTGLTWLSFLIQGRVSYYRELTDQAIVSRTYDMTTGKRVLLTDIFDDSSEGWDIMAKAVREQATAYFPGETPDEAVLDRYCTREGLQQLDFTLHGMSLVLHIPAQTLYPKHHTLIEVTLFYPDIRPYMTEKAQTETDNKAYYKMAALTFDDGPVRTNTTLVLNNMMEMGERATFFVIGNRVEAYADQVQKEHDNGHAVASHNWNHGNVKKSKPSALRAMPEKVDDAFTGAIGIGVRYNRVPHGLYNQMIKAKVGWPLIQWSLDTYDWRGRSVGAIMSAVKDQISDGDIILCHDIKDNTPDAARAICQYLQEQGYMLVTIDELFAKDGVTLQPDTVYYRCVDGKTDIKKR